jgi:hypothetical protein
LGTGGVLARGDNQTKAVPLSDITQLVMKDIKSSIKTSSLNSSQKGAPALSSTRSDRKKAS